MLALRLARMLGLCIGLTWAAIGLAAPPEAEPNNDSGETPAQTVPAGTGTEAKSPTMDTLCAAIATAAARTGLPLAFFTRLIWQESRFDPAAVSRKGALGVAQFMPETASWRGLRNPFDPLEAIPKAAELLAELQREFGNLGLAAAAYNAGPARVRDWMAGRRLLPDETRAYVRIVTGHTAAEWVAPAAAVAIADMPPDMPCRPGDQTLAAVAPANTPGPERPAPNHAAASIWGVQLIGSPSEALALAEWRQLQQKYRAILGGQQPIFIHTPIGTHGTFWHRVRVGASSLAEANVLCARLRASGGSCLVQRN